MYKIRKESKINSLFTRIKSILNPNMEYIFVGDEVYSYKNGRKKYINYNDLVDEAVEMMMNGGSNENQ